VELDWGQRGGVNEKPSVPKCSEGLRKSSGKLEKPFSSFLRGASCPKSPRFKCDPKTATLAATPASPFMLENTVEVKSNLFLPNEKLARFLFVEDLGRDYTLLR
jgi:hypothetical protein